MSDLQHKTFFWEEIYGIKLTRNSASSVRTLNCKYFHHCRKLAAVAPFHNRLDSQSLCSRQHWRFVAPATYRMTLALRKYAYHNWPSAFYMLTHKRLDKEDSNTLIVTMYTHLWMIVSVLFCFVLVHTSVWSTRGPGHSPARFATHTCALAVLTICSHNTLATGQQFHFTRWIVHISVAAARWPIFWCTVTVNRTWFANRWRISTRSDVS